MKERDFQAVNTIIGGGAAICGDVRVSGSVRVEGDLDGSLVADGWVQVGESARIRGDIVGDFVVVAGVVEGDVISRGTVNLYETAFVSGDILSAGVRLERDVMMRGKCVMFASDEDFESAKKSVLEKIAVKGKLKRA